MTETRNEYCKICKEYRAFVETVDPQGDWLCSQCFFKLSKRQPIENAVVRFE